MFYRPAFCCNCGEKIQREEWRLWTSRRFCALCETEQKGFDLIPRIIVVVGLVSMIFGIGSYFRRSASIVDGEDVVRSGKPKANLKPAALSENNSSSAANGFSQPNSPDLLVNDNRQINEQPKREKTTSDETVYFCGAITKKGTPCTRRVKTKGFCWQHAKSGQVAPARF